LKKGYLHLALALFRYILLGFNSVWFDCGDRSTLAISEASYLIQEARAVAGKHRAMRGTCIDRKLAPTSEATQ